MMAQMVLTYVNKNIFYKRIILSGRMKKFFKKKGVRQMEENYLVNFLEEHNAPVIKNVFSVSWVGRIV